MTRFHKLLITSILIITAATAFAQPEFYKNIKPIITKHCAPCHTKGSVGAMPLATYRQVAAYGNMIQYVTENRLMPPWKADASYSNLKDHNNLSEEEIELIKSWVNEGMKEGIEPKSAPDVKNKKPAVKPDVTFSMKQRFFIKDDYTETSQVFVFPINSAKDILVSGVEFVPGNRKVVKICTISVDTGNTGLEYDKNDEGYGYTALTGPSFIPSQYNWYQWTAEEAPGIQHFNIPKKLAAGSNLLLHITYAASSSLDTDSSYLKLYYADPVQSLVLTSEILIDTSHITNGPFTINVREKRKYYAQVQLKQKTTIYALMPMGQFTLSSWEVYALDPRGKRTNILRIPHWDAHWKKKYTLTTPLTLDAGSQIHAVAYYNNSDDNPNLIILPPKKIKYGDGQRDELFLISFDVLKY